MIAVTKEGRPFYPLWLYSHYFFVLPCMSDLTLKRYEETFLSSVILNFSFTTSFNLILQSFRETCRIFHAYFTPVWRKEKQRGTTKAALDSH